MRNPTRDVWQMEGTASCPRPIFQAQPVSQHLRHRTQLKCPYSWRSTPPLSRRFSRPFPPLSPLTSFSFIWHPDWILPTIVIPSKLNKEKQNSSENGENKSRAATVHYQYWNFLTLLVQNRGNYHYKPFNFGYSKFVKPYWLHLFQLIAMRLIKR